jgi:hypothetical protein
MEYQPSKEFEKLEKQVYEMVGKLLEYPIANYERAGSVDALIRYLQAELEKLTGQ